jgi:hypothetical protein
MMKAVIYRRYPSNPMKDLSWNQAYNWLNGGSCVNILGLMDLLRSLPPTSVKNESTFSYMKLTKSSRRGRLSNTGLDDILIVQMESRSIQDFDPKDAIEAWMVAPSGRSRRPTFKRCVSAQKSNQGNGRELAAMQIEEDEEEYENTPHLNVIPERPADEANAILEPAQIEECHEDEDEGFADYDEQDEAENEKFKLQLATLEN